MSKSRILMEKIREIIRLSQEQKMSLRTISLQTGASKTTVGEYLAEFKRSGLTYRDLHGLSDDMLACVFENSNCETNKKYEELSSNFANYLKELKRPGVTLYLLWKEYKNEHHDGFSYSRFCFHYTMWSGKHKPEMHTECRGGEKMFVDFAGKKQSIVDIETGEIIEVEVFVAILGASQKTYIESSSSQQKGDWIRLNENAVHYFGGVPKAIVPDNLKSGITKACKYEPLINETYKDFANHYNTVILPARPRKPKDKPLVESAVNLMYQRVYAAIRNSTFFSIDELNQSMWIELEKHNNTPFQKRDSTRNKLFDEIERDELMPLPSSRYELKEFKHIKVHFNYHVYIKEDLHYYSVPYQYIDQQVKVAYTYSIIEIYFGNERVALHKRSIKQYGYTTQKDHMPANHQFVSGWNCDRFLSWSKKIGEEVHLFIQKLLESKEHPEQAFRACMGVLNLGKKHGTPAFEIVCKKALEINCISYTFIKNALKNKIYLIPIDMEQNTLLPEHENIRGKLHYK